MTAADKPLLCPSASPYDAEARVFAVVGGSVAAPQAAYLEASIPVTPDVLALAGPVDPAEVFRAAAPCANHRCGNFDHEDHGCRLARKTVRLAPVVVHRLPRCAIRSSCLWWAQEGASACQRCPQVVTWNAAASDAMRQAADPAVC